MHKILLSIILLSLLSSLYGETLVSDSLLITQRDDHKYISRIIKENSSHRDTLYLVKTTNSEKYDRYFYEIEKNGISKWQLTVSSPASDLEALFVKHEHNKEIATRQEFVDSTRRGVYRNTPWNYTPSIFSEVDFPEKMVDWFAWQKGAKINFHRNHLYNFNVPPEDTSEVFIDMGEPAMYEYSMDLSYTHRYRFVWFGAGVNRSFQLCKHMDTLSIDRGKWFSRMGWNVQVALPGFKYEMYRDPGLIPHFSRYEPDLYLKLYPDAKYTYSNSLNIIVDTTFKLDTNDYIPSIIDTIWIPHKIAPLGGIGHHMTVKVGYFEYDIYIHGRAYKAPIQKIGLRNMPFFRGEWDIGMLILPTKKLIPQLEIDAFRTSIPLGDGFLGISPFHMQVEIWGREYFFFSLGFNAEYRMGNASFRKD